MKILMVIPARSGSRRLKDKNILPLGNKPLIAWTIEAAEKAACKLKEHRTSIIVSTDSEKYAKIAGKIYHVICSMHLGAKAYKSYKAATEHICPFLRPPEISGDVDSGLISKHAWEYERDRAFTADVTLLLQPTSPFRTADDIVNVVRTMEGAPDLLDSCITVKPVSEFPQWMMQMSEGRLQTWLGFPFKYLSGFIAQEIPPLFSPNGAIYGMRPDVVKQGRLYGDSVGGVIMDHMSSIDIEIMADLEYARWLVDTGRMP